MAKPLLADTLLDLTCGLPGRIGRALKWIRRGRKAMSVVKAVSDDHLPEWVGNHLARKVCPSLAPVFCRAVDRAVHSKIANVRFGRSPILSLPSGRYRLVVIYHDADRAGPHIDIHIGKISLVKRLPQDFKLSFNDGILTQASKDRIMTLIADEFKGRARLAQNADHSETDAVYQWVGREAGPTGYGSGETRQLVSDEPCYTWTGPNALHISAPHIINNRTLFLYQLYPGKDNKAPILSLGVKNYKEPEVRDRLHLKMTQDVEEFKKLVGDGQITVKYDGASCYIEQDEHGTRIWSPRISKKDGRRIEYTAKLPEIATQTGNSIAMGELLFKRNGKYLSAAEIGGILNGGHLSDAQPEIRVYRIDKGEQPKGQIFKQPEIVRQVRIDPRIEGLVGIPEGQTVEEGVKLKWRTDYMDAIIESVEFGPGSAGGITGVVRYRDPETGRTYKTASGMSHRLKMAMARNADDLVGCVMKLEGFPGHAARAATFRGFHMDKGQAVPQEVLDAV